MHKVFISHSTKDKEIADKIVEFLEANNIKCWISHRDAETGSPYAESIINSIKDTQIFLLVFSEASNSSPHVLREVDNALKHKKTIMPFKINNTNPQGAMEYYLSSTHWLDAVKGSLENHFKNLLAAMHKYLIMNDNEALVIDGLKAIELFGVENLVKRFIELDYDTLENLTKENEGEASQWIDIRKVYPESFSVLLVNKEVVGYWSFVGLDNENFEKAKRGELLEQDINFDNVEFMKLPGDYNGYFVMITILLNHRTIKNFQLLVNAFIEQIEKLAENNIFFLEWCANGFSNEGRAMCKSLKMQYVCNNILEGEIYHSRIEPMLEASPIKRYPKLIELYKNHLLQLPQQKTEIA